MPAICEQELLEIYHRLEPLFLNQGFSTEIALIRDYLLKIKISENGNDLGKLNIDYSPKKGSHNFRKDSDLDEKNFQRILGILGVSQPAKKLENSQTNGTPNKQKPQALAPKIVKDVSDVNVHAYVDGSFIEGSVGYGAVILEQGTVVAEISGAVDSPDAFNSRQVGGEIQAVLEVLKWCKRNEVSQIAVFYDFQNIEKWATGEYRTNTPMTQAYKKSVDESGITIVWVKVESHTGVALNDRADELAKNGAKKLGQSLISPNQAEQMSLFGNESPRQLKGWIIFNGSLLTPKYTDQVDWLVRAAKKHHTVLVPYHNDELGAAVINGELSLVASYEKPDFVLFWDKDVRLARQLERMGFKLFNSAEAIMVCDDKIMTHMVLAHEQIPMPKTLAAPLVFPGCPVDESLFIQKIEQVLSYPMIVKEAFGSFGAQVYMAKNREELLSLRKRLISTPHLYQEYIRSSHGRDVRLQVVGSEVVAGMLRTSETDFRANISAGGKMVPFIPSKAFSDLAVKAAKLVGANFAGVDLLFGPSESPILCEVNSNAHMKNIYDCTGVDVAERIILHIRDQLK